MFVRCWSMTIFFFFKQKTAYEMRISDWSSDVCSSDLKLDRHHVLEEEVLDGLVEAIDRQRADAREIPFGGDVELIRDRWFQIRIAAGGGELKRVADRKSVV